MKISITICDEATKVSHVAVDKYEHATDALVGLMEKIASDPCFSKLDTEIQEMISEAMHFKEWFR